MNKKTSRIIKLYTILWQGGTNLKKQLNFIQIVRLNQLTNETLIRGVDIAKHFNITRAFDFKSRG
ncbi:hypothetical protein BD821_12712 [Clostridium algidicarnis DSM 15099]|uniref:Uncharacterized protein n=1 Tax=Clostridium algidicarnis DSM 15099 TaxID=1121295 RepID=A0A2S6FU90_9CLOT|nr:hypothetical protein BD821_12712 [Clostridium algidicarnis DSM 15099]